MIVIYCVGGLVAHILCPFLACSPIHSLFPPGGHMLPGLSSACVLRALHTVRWCCAAVGRWQASDLLRRGRGLFGGRIFFLNRSQSSSQSDWMLDSGRVHTHIHPGRNTQRRFSPTAAAAAAPAGQSNRIYNYTRRRPPCPCPFLSNKKGRGTRWATRTAGACHRICDYH
jgi:hypothetical protein